MTERRRDDLDLTPLRAGLAAHGVLIAARRIRDGDEQAFAGATTARLAQRRASGAARIAARDLLGALGANPDAPLPRSRSGAPVWPDGILGSLAHDEIFALAVAARQGAVIGLGADIEPAQPLPADLTKFVLTPGERRLIGDDATARRLVFTAKEAVYKAIHPLDGSPLEYADIAVRLDEGIATLRDGRRLKLLALRAERLVAVALALASSS